jgi:hypothetical protein
MRNSRCVAELKSENKAKSLNSDLTRVVSVSSKRNSRFLQTDSSKAGIFCSKPPALTPQTLLFLSRELSLKIPF